MLYLRDMKHTEAFNKSSICAAFLGKLGYKSSLQKVISPVGGRVFEQRREAVSLRNS